MDVLESLSLACLEKFGQKIEPLLVLFTHVEDLAFAFVRDLDTQRVSSFPRQAVKRPSNFGVRCFHKIARSAKVARLVICCLLDSDFIACQTDFNGTSSFITVASDKSLGLLRH